MFNFLRKPKGTGALSDPREIIDKEKDFRAEEVVTFGPVNWVEKSQSDWKKYPIYNQSSSSSCVAQSVAKSLSILNQQEEGGFIRLSARDIYTRRSNKPSAGMWGQDACEIARKFGATYEFLMPSENKNEADMNIDTDRKPSYEVVGKIFRAKNWLALPFNIDAIASIVAQKPVMLFFRFDMSEWDRAVPELNPASTKSAHHAVTAVDYFLYQGKKALLIEDSWGSSRGIEGRRIITEDWMSRLSWASYFEDLSNLEILNIQIDKPKLNLKRLLKVNDRGSDVAQLQRALGYLKDNDGYLFPLAQEPTGAFFGVSRNAIQRFQKMYNLQITGIVDKETLKKLNEIFN